MGATAAQITANRENSKLSTGPRTPDGLAASKFNAIRHGLTSSQAVIKGEDPEAFETLRADRVEANIVAQLGRLQACFLDEKATRKYNNFQRHSNTIERAWNRC